MLFHFNKYVLCKVSTKISSSSKTNGLTSSDTRALPPGPTVARHLLSLLTQIFARTLYKAVAFSTREAHGAYFNIMSGGVIAPPVMGPFDLIDSSFQFSKDLCTGSLKRWEKVGC